MKLKVFAIYPLEHSSPYYVVAPNAEAAIHWWMNQDMYWTSDSDRPLWRLEQVIRLVHIP